VTVVLLDVVQLVNDLHILREQHLLWGCRHKAQGVRCRHAAAKQEPVTHEVFLVDYCIHTCIDPVWVPGLRIDPLGLLAGCRERRLNQAPLNFRGLNY